MFNRLRVKVLENVDKVPRYTCVETVTRTQYRPQYGKRPDSCALLIAARAQNPSQGLLMWHDRLRLDVAVGESSEMFSWAGARSFESGDLSELTSSGSTGTGDFGAFLASVFGGYAQDFRYVGEQDTSLGRLAAFEYTVPLARSHYSYRTGNGGKGTIGYGGTFYAAPATADLKRLVVDARDFSSGEVCHVLDTMDYATVKIGAGDFLLPNVSRMVVLYRNGEETANETHYSGCHEFTGETTIRFDDPDEPNTPAAVTKLALKALPPRTQIKVKIDPPIDSATAAAGDPITGLVEHDFKQGGKVIVRASDRLHGRLLRLEQFMFPEPHWVVAIRFEAIEREGVEQPVELRPLDDGDRSPPRTSRSRAGRIPLPERPARSGIFVLPGLGNLVLDQKFHSEWETK
ncbi:MAG: hypothetical protein M3N54_06415 [Acidobacteriota bacterium]|nr:hypothetical protein [Acidobacteriota bacterium]